MASTAARSPSESAPSGTTFSYAQAAKGVTSNTAPSSVQSHSQGPSGTNTPKDSSASASIIPNGPTNASIDRQNGDESSKPKSGSVDLENTAKSSLAAISRSLPSSPSYGATINSPLLKEDETSAVPSLASDSPWEKRTSSDAADKPADSSERKKGKKSKKDKAADKEAEKEKEEVKQEVLIPAPPPAINFWTQRKEAAAAKVKPATQVPETPQALPTEAVSPSQEPITASKVADSKKKVKTGVSEEAEKSTPPVLNGTVKEQANSIKGQKKGSDVSNKTKDEPTTKRSGPRGSRTGEKEEKSTVVQAPPPVEDAISWPTPESALEEEKRKAQEKMAQEKVEKEEKDEPTASKPRQKKEWVTVPYIPTVTFNTPLPARGGRGRGGNRGGRESGGRGGHAASGSVSGDKAANANSVASNTNTESRERGRESSGSARATSLPPNTSKRPAGGDSSYNTRDQRKTSATSTFDKSRNEAAGPNGKADQGFAGHNRRLSTATQIESGVATQFEGRTHSLDTGRSINFDQSNGPSGEQVDPRAPERRSDGNIRLGDFPRDSSSQSRERGEGRGDRGGRGGYRGRGGNNNFQNGQQHNQQSFPNGHPSHPQNAFALRQNAGPYSPPLQPPQYPPPFPQQASRGGARNGPPRTQSIPNGNTIYGRFPPTVAGQPQMAPIQTTGPMFDYSGMQSMSAVPFNPYLEQYSMLAMVTMQLEYYFSIDNLCKDVFLRKHMDGQGFVFLKFIANFKRIQQLTQDLDLLRYACQESEVIDIVVADDGFDRVRRQDGWEKWVLATEERDESVRNPGPERVYRQVPLQRAQPIVPRMIAPGQTVMSPPPFSPNGTEQGFRPFGPGPVLVNGNEGVYAPPTESPLSAAVPDFAPASEQAPADYHGVEVQFTDAEVEKLNLVYTQKSRDEAKATPPTHNISSRTFSNGSIDGRTITEELQRSEERQGRPLTNGGTTSPEISSESLKRSRSPFSMSPTKIVFGSAPPILWMKGQQDPAPVQESNKEEPYSVVRARALRHRESALPGETDEDMKILFEFWSHFLVRNFNPQMYEEFRACAFDDVNQRQANFGVTNLITFYDEVLNSKKRTIPEIFAKHYIELVKGEDPSGARPGFAKLRAAWRNGALDMKSRKKIDNFVDPQLREELEK